MENSGDMITWSKGLNRQRKYSQFAVLDNTASHTHDIMGLTNIAIVLFLPKHDCHVITPGSGNDKDCKGVTERMSIKTDRRHVGNS